MWLVPASFFPPEEPARPALHGGVARAARRGRHRSGADQRQEGHRDRGEKGKGGWYVKTAKGINSL